MTEFRVNTYIHDAQSNPKVASLGNGGFVVVWHSHMQDGSSWGVYGQRYDKYGNKAGEEFRVNSYTTSHQMHPYIAKLADTTFLVTWDSNGQDGHSHGIYGQRFANNGDKIGEEFRINTHTNNAQSGSSIAAFSDGGFVVTWFSYQGINDAEIYAQIYDSYANRVGEEFRVNSYTSGGQHWPSVAVFDNNSFVIAWHSGEQDMDGWGVYAQRFEDNGHKIGEEFRVNSYIADHQYAPSVASLGFGGFVITWTSGEQEASGTQDGSYRGVYGQRFNSNGNKIGGEFRVNSYTSSNQSATEVIGQSDGGFIVAWRSYGQDTHYGGVFAKRYDSNGITIGEEFQVNTHIISEQTHPFIARLSNNRFVVVWQSGCHDGDVNCTVDNTQDGSSWGIYGQRYMVYGEEVIAISAGEGGGKSNGYGIRSEGDIVIKVWSPGKEYGVGKGIVGSIYNYNSTSEENRVIKENIEIENANAGGTRPTVVSIGDGRYVIQSISLTSIQVN